MSGLEDTGVVSHSPSRARGSNPTNPNQLRVPDNHHQSSNCQQLLFSKVQNPEYCPKAVVDMDPRAGYDWERFEPRRYPLTLQIRRRRVLGLSEARRHRHPWAGGWGSGVPSGDPPTKHLAHFEDLNQPATPNCFPCPKSQALTPVPKVLPKAPRPLLHFLV